MPDGGLGGLVAVGVRTAIVLAALVVGVRLFGRRQLGEMNVRDLLMVLVMANAVQNAMTKGDGHLTVALVSAGTLLGLGWLVSFATFHLPALGRIAEGQPVVIVRDGQVSRANMKRVGISHPELMAQVRDQGLAEIEGVALAVAEVGGSISVVPKERPGQERQSDQGGAANA